MSSLERITQEEMQALPRWARLAFAARCTRRACALLGTSPDQLQVIERAVALTEAAGRDGHADEQLAEAAAAAYTVALNRVDPAGRAATASGQADEDAVIVTCTVAHAAAFAAEAATIADAPRASFLVAQSIDFALHAHIVARADHAAVVAAVRADLRRLQEAARRDGWDERTRVPAEFFGPR